MHLRRIKNNQRHLLAFLCPEWDLYRSYDCIPTGFRVASCAPITLSVDLILRRCKSQKAARVASNGFCRRVNWLAARLALAHKWENKRHEGTTFFLPNMPWFLMHQEHIRAGQLRYLRFNVKMFYPTFCGTAACFLIVAKSLQPRANQSSASDQP